MDTLVTGGAGLIGSHVVDLLLERGDRVRVLDNLEPTTHLEGRPDWLPVDVELVQGDMRNADDVARALQGIQVVFHLAAYGGFAPELTKMTDVNATGTARIFETIREQGLPIEKIVTASSQAVYGEGRYSCPHCGPSEPGPRPLEQLECGDWELLCPVCSEPMQGDRVSEDAALRFTSLYALTKFFEERLTLTLGVEWGIPTVALRYALTYGPRQSVFNPYTGICSIFSTRFLNGLPPVIYEDGLQTRDFVFAGDVARATVLVSERPEADHCVFNVGTGRATTILEFADLLRRAYGGEVEPIVDGSFRPLDARHLVADASRLRAIGWEPSVTPAEGVQRYVDWILSRPRPQEYFSEVESALRRIGVVRARERARA